MGNAGFSLPGRAANPGCSRLCIRLFTITILLGTCAAAQQPARLGQPRTIPLWEQSAPGALGNEDIDKPELTLYPAYGRETSGTAVIVCPGGAYGALAMNHEGRQVANWVNALGVTAVVLKYRPGPRYRHPIEVGDAQP